MGKFGWIAVTAGIVIAIGIIARQFFPDFFNKMTTKISDFFTESIDKAANSSKGSN